MLEAFFAYNLVPFISTVCEIVQKIQFCKNLYYTYYLARSTFLENLAIEKWCNTDKDTLTEIRAYRHTYYDFYEEINFGIIYK